MIVKELVTTEILPVMTSETCATALSQMEENQVHHLPVVNNRELLGVVSEFDLVSHGHPEDPIGAVTLSLNNAFLADTQHVFDAMIIITEMKLTLVPVTDAKGNYIGIITLHNLIAYLARNSSILNPGGIIILEMTENNYSLAEIAQIVESNDAKILSMCVTSRVDSTLIDVTLKLNVIDLVPVIQTLQRFNYNIRATFGERDDLDDLKERYDALMNFLNI
jgi:acetoin utilization protein AcuB